MGRTIIITERQERLLMKLLREESGIGSLKSPDQGGVPQIGLDQVGMGGEVGGEYSNAIKDTDEIGDFVSLAGKYGIQGRKEW